MGAVAVLGEIWEVVSPARNGASRLSCRRTGECGLIRARSRRDSSQRAWRAAVRSSRIWCDTWAYRPRIPGTSWPSLCSARISGMPSSHADPDAVRPGPRQPGPACYLHRGPPTSPEPPGNGHLLEQLCPAALPLATGQGSYCRGRDKRSSVTHSDPEANTNRRSASSSVWL
jgi:hypothetical protein